jgi:hypothetical protein
MAWGTVDVIAFTPAFDVCTSYWDREIIYVAVTYPAFVASPVYSQVTSGDGAFHLRARGTMVAEEIAFG